MAQVTPSANTTPVVIKPGTGIRIRFKDGEIESRWYHLSEDCSIYDSRCIPLDSEVTKTLLGISFTPGTPVEFKDFILLDAYN